MTMEGLRSASIGRANSSFFLLRESEDSNIAACRTPVLFGEFNDPSDVGVRMPDLGRDASEFEPTCEDIVM